MQLVGGYGYCSVVQHLDLVEGQNLDFVDGLSAKKDLDLRPAMILRLTS